VRPRILDRLVARSFLRLFLIFVLAAPLLFILGDATENLDRYLDRGLGTGQVLLSYVYQFPMFMFWAFPIAALLAAVFTIQPMTVHREVMAAKAGGISFHRLVAPLIVLGVLLTGAGLFLAELVPKATQRAAEIREERDRRQGWLSQFVYLTDAGESLMARRLTVGDGRMTGIVLLREAEEPGEPTIHIVAGEGVWEDGNGWRLRDGYVRELLPDGEERLQPFEALDYERLTERPDELVDTVRDEDEMSRAEPGASSAREGMRGACWSSASSGWRFRSPRS
jgi:lipopolysaccharide export system permease protein